MGKASTSPRAKQNADPGYTVVGHTPDGKPCDLTAAGQPGTGEQGEIGDPGIASQTHQGLAAGAFAVLGLSGALLVARKRRG